MARLTPRTFGDGGGVSRRDHAVRTANEQNAGAGGLRDIDAVLRENESLKPKMGVERGVDRLFRTMSMLPDNVAASRDSEVDLDNVNRDIPRAYDHPIVPSDVDKIDTGTSWRDDPYHPMFDVGPEHDQTVDPLGEASDYVGDSWWEAENAQYRQDVPEDASGRRAIPEYQWRSDVLVPARTDVFGPIFQPTAMNREAAQYSANATGLPVRARTAYTGSEVITFHPDDEVNEGR